MLISVATAIYDNPDSNRNTVMSTMSLEVAPGAMYDLPEPGTATYDNPLASAGRPPAVPRRDDSLNDKHGVMGEQYDSPNTPIGHSGIVNCHNVGTKIAQKGDSPVLE